MRKISVLVGLFVLSMTLSTSNLYAACNISNGKIEVSKGGACQSIQTAINKADGVNPLLISVLPGTYTEQVTMKPYVSLVGSGQENTKITSSVAATVTGASSTSIENIWVDNTNATVNHPTAILNVPNINKVKVTASGSNDMTSGINISSITNAIVSNCNISVSGDVETLGIITGSNSTVTNSVINTIATSTQNKWNTGLYGSDSGVNISDTVITSQGAKHNYAIYSNPTVTLRNVEMTSIAGAPGENYLVRGNVVITGSKLILGGDMTNACIINAGTSQIGGSMISGLSSQSGYCSTPKVVNSWDANFNPIPNQ